MNDQTIDDLKICGVEAQGIMGFLKALWLNPSFLAIYCYRRSHQFYASSGWRRLLSRAIWRYAVTHCGCDIRSYAKIGARCHFPHPVGVVIGSDAVVGDDVTIYQNVTLGLARGTNGFPTIKNDVTIYAGASVLGDITIGEGAIIGANAVVLDDVHARGVAVGAPARILKK